MSSSSGSTPHWRRSRFRRGRSAFGPSTPSVARSCSPRGAPSIRSWIGTPLIRAVASWAGPAERRQLDTLFSALKLEHRVTADVIADDPAAGPRARAFVAYERALADAWRTRLRRPRRTPARHARFGSGPAGLVALGLSRAARRRGPGRRSVPARAGTPDRGACQPDLPRRRRRPVDLWLAAGGRPASPGDRRAAAGTPAPRPDHELPLPGPGRRAGRAARRAQHRAVRQADRCAARRRRAHRPRAGPDRRRRTRLPRPGQLVERRRRPTATRPRRSSPGRIASCCPPPPSRSSSGSRSAPSA